MAIQDYKVSEAYSGRDISSLSDRPNQDGMSASQLKARFDQLGKEVIPNYNDLIDFIETNLFSGSSTNDHTHNVDNLEDGTVNRNYTQTDKNKLDGIATGAEVNQNAFSNIKVGSSTIPSTTKTDTIELVAGLNIKMTVDVATKKVFLSATGDLATEAVQSYIEDIGNYFTSLNVEGALQEVGAKLSPSSSKTTPVDADTLLISDSADSNIFKKLSWLNIKGTLKTYFDGLYATIANLNLKAPLANPTFTGTQTLPNIVTNGVKFPATQVPSANPNTLDDYEEGTFTPVATPTNGSFVSSSAYGQYVKIGKAVTCVVEVIISNIGSGSNGLNIASLPFICSSLTGSAIVVGQETSLTGNLIYGYITSNTLGNILKYDRTSALLNNGSYKLLFTYITD